MINRLAIDISHYNGLPDFGKVWDDGVRLVILKASESLSADDVYTRNRAAIKASGHDFLIGAYHFGRGSDPKQQVDAFFKYAQPDDNMGLFLDWEVASMTTPIARSFLETCDARWGRKTGLYSYKSFLDQNLGAKADTFFGLHPLWFAEYGSNVVGIQSSWSKYFLWQFSDGQVGPMPHKTAGIPGDCDESSFDGSEQDLRLEWDAWMRSGYPSIDVVAPPPPEKSAGVGGDRAPLFAVVRSFTLGNRLVQRQVDQLDAVLDSWTGDGARLVFFNLVRDMTAYGRFTQAQVDQLDAAIDAWLGQANQAQPKG